ncbi:MAG TPA: hypothetical protein VG860_23575 [Terriglobia bacterium]|jgi:hypothetical protein|nr:hypothetical protein [Terriglobia bacterium]
MDAGVLIPLATFAAVVVIVGLVNFSGLRDRELTALESIRRLEAEHNLRMAELDRELRRVKQGE